MGPIPLIVYLPGAIANPGDISRDGTVDAADALMTLQHSVGLVTMQKDDQLLADLNDDNHVDASDALIMLQISVEIIQ